MKTVATIMLATFLLGQKGRPQPVLFDVAIDAAQKTAAVRIRGFNK